MFNTIVPSTVKLHKVCLIKRVGQNKYFAGYDCLGLPQWAELPDPVIKTYNGKDAPDLITNVRLLREWKVEVREMA